VYDVTMVRKVNKRGWGNKEIKALRQHLGLTQNEMAERLGTRQQTISEWEIGMYQPRGASVTLLSIVADSSGFKYEGGTVSPERKGQSKNPALSVRKSDYG
jgi:transcriptional regulator with XRE-family HTH domain